MVDTQKVGVFIAQCRKEHNWTQKELGEKLGVTPAGTGERIAALLKAFALPTAIPCTAEEYAAAVGLDKKGSGGDIQVLLLEEMGKAVPHRMTKAALLEELK